MYLFLKEQDDRHYKEGNGLSLVACGTKWR